MKFIYTALLLMTIFAFSVSAELVTITTDLNITTNNQLVNIIAEGKEISFTCGNESVSPGRKTLSFTRELTCANEAELRAIASTLSMNLNNSQKYYDKYLECYANQKLCEDKGTTQTDLQPKVDALQSQLDACKEEKSTLSIARQSADSAKSTCETARTKAESERTTWGFVGFAAGAGLVYFIFGRKRAPAQSVAEQQLPKSR